MNGFLRFWFLVVGVMALVSFGKYFSAEGSVEEYISVGGVCLAALMLHILRKEDDTADKSRR